MKRIMILLAIAGSIFTANAQKSTESIRKAIEDAKLATENPKKAAKVGTWLSLAKAYDDAYNASVGNAYVGCTKQEAELLMNGAKPVSTSVETLAGGDYTVAQYNRFKYYYNANGVLEMVITTKPVVKNALGEALKAYAQAAVVDAKGSKTKDINAGIQKIYEAYSTNAYNAYKTGDYKGASAFFAKAAKASATEPYSKLDTSAYYNSGLLALMAGEVETAKAQFTKCVDLGYLEKGEVFAKLSDCYNKLEDKEAAKKALEDGFKAFPGNQSVIIGLINYYLDNKEDTSKLFALLDAAKVNEPNNASLYYVEGNIRKELGEFEAAAAAYDKCSEVDAKYEYGHIGKGIMYYNIAADIAEKAQNEYDDKKYEALAADFKTNFLKAAESFELGFEKAKDNSVKVSLAEYLKTIYYRFQNESDDYKAKFEKYSNIAKNGLQ